MSIHGLHTLRRVLGSRKAFCISRLTEDTLVKRNCHQQYHQKKGTFGSSYLKRAIFDKISPISFLPPSVKNMSTQPEVIYDFSMPFLPEELKSRADQLITRCHDIYNDLGSMSPDSLTTEKFFKALADIEQQFETEKNYWDFPQHVSPHKAIRDASTEASKKLEQFVVEISMHQGIFNNLLAFQSKKPQLTPEENRFLERLIKLGKRNGLHLSNDIQEKVKTIKKKISELSIQFLTNMNEENTVLEFSDDELQGLPKDFIANLAQTDDGKRKVTLKYPHYFPIMRKAKNPETRRKLDYAFNRQCIEENTKILEELVTLRHELANLLGFPTHAAYITDLRMAKTTENVRAFLDELAEKLKVMWEKEKKVWLDFKQKECSELGLTFNGEINNWDTGFYTTMVEEKLFAVDQEKLREYFSLPVVTEGLLEIYQELLNLKFEEIKNPNVWHKDVQMFKVIDVKSGELMGYFFLDLFPREGKYGHAAVFPLQPACILGDGKRQVAVASMEANFTKPTADKPSLLDHREVVTFFHEFGHVMHNMCSEATVAHFSGTSVERDFVEAPSQMLENWCWEAESLKRMSAHYLDGSPMPEDILGCLVRSRLANVAYSNMRQIMLALFDHTIHTRSQADTSKLIADIGEELLGIRPAPDTNFSAHFGHLAGSYDAQYYGYMWSEVFSMDMFQTKFKREGIMNPTIGIEYRQKVLAPGGSKDASDMLVEFLGREPNQEAFLISKGIKTS